MNVKRVNGRFYFRYRTGSGRRLSAPLSACADLETAVRHAIEVRAIADQLRAAGAMDHVEDVVRRAAAQKPGDLDLVWKLAESIVADAALGAVVTARHPQAILDELAEVEARTLVGDDPVVYFIADAFGHVKIGRAKDIYVRLATIQNAHAQPVKLVAVQPGGRRLERELHERFAKYRVRGEWFRVGLGIVEHVLSLRRGG